MRTKDLKIPPNCGFFKKKYFYQSELDSTWVFSVWNSSMEPLDLDFMAPEFNLASPWLLIIADTGIVAWQEEKERTMKELELSYSHDHDIYWPGFIYNQGEEIRKTTYLEYAKRCLIIADIENTIEEWKSWKKEIKELQNGFFKNTD